jgi:myo-inositol-1(or 4)-monophosphatase
VSTPGTVELHDPAALDRLCRLAEQAARVGGAVARGYFRTDLNIRFKADRSEVSEADEAAQAAVMQCIHAPRPHDAFIGEEAVAGPHAGDAPAATNDHFCWVIDPIDGTRNFVRGIPCYACSVAVMFGGFPLAGAIYDVERDVLYSAIRGGPLLVNGNPARPPSGEAEKSGRLRLVVGIPSRAVGPLAKLSHDWLSRYVCRNLGSTALHMAMVATGELDGMLADTPRLWDVAAGWVLIESAGGRVVGPDGAPLFPLDVGGYRGTQTAFRAARASAASVLLG